MNLKTKPEIEQINLLMKNDSSVSETYFNTYEKFEDVPDAKSFNKHNKMIKETMFADHYSLEIKAQLINCKRVLPHH